MESEDDIILVSQEIIQEAERIQQAFRNPNPHLTFNLPMLPIYLGEISPLNPVNTILQDLHLMKVLNHF